MPTSPENFDVIIIGGSYAGLSAAMALGRSLRKVLVIDSAKPCNASTPYSHNFLTQDGKKPAEIHHIAKDQVAAYQTIQFLEDEAIEAKQIDGGFSIHCRGGQNFAARKIILATGIRDLLLPIPGLEACWGKSVVHCPYCHGYELKQQKTGIIANGEAAFHLAGIVNNLSPQLQILSNGEPDFDSTQKAILERHQIQVLDSPIQEIIHHDGMVQEVRFENGTTVPFDVLYARIPFEQQSNIPSQLGLELLESGHVKIDHTQKTSLNGVYAAGDNSNMMRSVANAIASGNLAGAIVNKELVDEHFIV